MSIRRFAHVVASASSALTVRRFSLTAALVLTSILGVDVVCAFVADSVLGEGVGLAVYVASPAAWLAFLVVRTGDEVQATAAADRRVVLARLDQVERSLADRPKPDVEQ